MSTSYIIPPMNFGIVDKQIYRSGFVRGKNASFLRKLNLKTIINLTKTDYNDSILQFIRENNIQLLNFPVEGNKEPFIEIPYHKLYRALIEVLDERNHPLLIHCNKGKHRTGCLVGVYRKFNSWSVASIFDEYRFYSGAKARTLDLQYIELFKLPPQLPQSEIQLLNDSYKSQ